MRQYYDNSSDNWQVYEKIRHTADTLPHKTHLNHQKETSQPNTATFNSY